MHTRRPSQQVSRELAQLRNTPAPQVPDLVMLTARMNRLTAEATIDPTKRSDLAVTLVALQEGEKALQAIGERNRALDNLQKELDEVLQLERLERIAVADDHLNQAASEYKHACLIAAKSLRALLNAQHQSAQVPGAAYQLTNLRLEKFNVGHLMPMSWQGTLGETMVQGQAQFEVASPPALNPHLKVA